MSYTVAKQFRSINQVFVEGVPVAPENQILLPFPLTFDALVSGGFIADQDPPSAPDGIEPPTDPGP